MTAETFFENPFSASNIFPFRLYTFANDTISRLNGDNPSNVYTIIIAKLVNNTKLVGDELGELQSTLAVQVGKTQTVDEVIKAYKTL